MKRKIYKLFLLSLVGVAFTSSSCSNGKLLFDNTDLGCLRVSICYASLPTFEDLFEYSDYVYKIQIKSYKGYAKSAYQCATYDCWSFKILSVYKEEKDPVNIFYINCKDYGLVYPEISVGQEYYIFLKDYTGENKYIHDGFITFTEESYSDCLVTVINE